MCVYVCVFVCVSVCVCACACARACVVSKFYNMSTTNSIGQERKTIKYRQRRRRVEIETDEVIQFYIYPV